MGILITCLPPFDQMREAVMFSIKDGEAEAVFAPLTAAIRSLQTSLLASENAFTLQWCTEAVALLKKMHSELLILFENSKSPSPSNGESRSNLLDEYMNESLSIMELCNLLKSAASNVNRYCLMIDFAAKNMQNGHSSLHEIQKLEFDSNKETGIQRWKKTTNMKKHVMMHKHKCRDNSSVRVISMLRSAMSTISMILLNAVSHPIPIKQNKFYSLSPEIESFMQSVKDLTSCFEQKRLQGEGLGVGILEYVMMEKEIEETKAQLGEGMAAANNEKLQRRRRLIEQRCMAVKAGLEVFESEISQLFEEVLGGRNKLLQMIMKKDAT